MRLFLYISFYTDGPIQCQKCFMVCSGPSSLATHNKFRCQINNEHHLWRCIHCDRSFKTPQSLQRHKNIHKGLKPYACRICGKVFSHPSSRNRHHSLHFNIICSCKMCGMVFSNSISLGHHEKTVHAYRRLSNGKFECTECDKAFADWKCLRRHKKRLLHRNADACTCKTCGKLFRKKENLLRHEALHKPSFLAEPYKCQHCGLCFTSGIGLSNHKRIHVNKNVSEGKSDKGGISQKTTSNSVQNFPTKGLLVVRGKKYSTCHVCQICKAPFAYSFNLARHIREKHPRVKIIKCRKCAKVCVSKRELAVHIAMKHETRKYDSKQSSLESVKCSQCNFTFPECQLLNHACVYQKAKVNEGTTTQDSESKRTVQASDGKHNISQRPSQDQTVYSSVEFRCEFCTKGFPSLSLMHCHRAAHFRKKNPTLPVSLGVTSKVSNKESPYIYRKVSMNEGATAQESESARTMQALDGKYNISQSSSQDHTAYSSEKFRCEFCAKVFSSLSLMYCHRAAHFRKKNRALLNPFGVSSITPNKETPRLDTAQPRNGQFTCGVCCKEFPSLRLMHCHKGCHFRKKKRVREMSGDRCDKPFNSKESLRQHKCHRAENALSVSWSSVKRVESSAVHCKVYNESFHKETSLRSHMTHHSRNTSHSNHSSPPNPSPKSSKFLSEDKRFKCDVCAREFTSKDSLRSHKSHHSRFGKMQVTLPKQVVDANAQEPRVCKVCCESFQSRRSLSQHKRSHAGIKTAFACPFCRKGFSFKQNLLRHKRNQHDRPYKCQRCGEGFRTVQGRLRHFLKHDSVKQDQKCPSSTETDPVKCEALRVPQICCLHCDKRFMTCKGRYKHMRKYHSEESKVGLWKCPYCSEVFQNGSAMKKHVKNKHAKRKRSEDQQGCKKEDKDGIETTNSKVAERTHTCSEADTIAPWKCEFCSKVFQSVSGMKKHVKKNHSKRRKSEASRQWCKPQEKDGIETTNSKVTGRTQSWSEWLNIAPWKCRFCSKVFPSVSGVEKHVKKKHLKRRKSEVSHQGCKPEEKDDIEINNSKATERTQSWSEWVKLAPWKCQFCSKVCQSVSCMQKHVKKRHSSRIKSEASHKVCKPEEKDGIEIDNSNVTERTQSWSVPAKIAPWKCQFCSKVFQSVSGMKKHVTKKHSRKKRYQSPDQDCKQEGKDGTEVTNSGTTLGALEVCRRCKARFFAFGSGNKCVYCIHCNKELSLEGNDNGSGCEDEFVSGVIQDEMHCLRQKKNGQLLASARAFKCQYCQKGVSKINSLYKHIMIAHGKEFGSNYHGSCTRFVNQSERKNSSIPQACAANVSVKAFQNCEDHRVARNLNAQPRGVKFKTVRMKAGTRGTKHTVQCNRFRCWYSRREFLSRGCRGRHEIKSHGNQVAPSSLRPKLDVDKTFISKTLHERPLWSKDENNREGKSRACIDGPHAKKCYPRNKAFPCEYCPKQFLQVTSRYRHVMLAHTGVTNAFSKVCQLKPQVPTDKTSAAMPLFCSDRSIASSSTPIKRKKDVSNLDCQPENKKFRRHDVNFGSGDPAGMWSFNRQTVTSSKPFPCEFCDKRFSTFSLQYKHFFLVHSGSQALADQGVTDSKALPTMKVSELSDSFNAVCNESASSYSHGDPTRRHISPSQRNILRDGSSDAGNCLKTRPSVAVTTSEPYKCEICCTTLRTKSEWSKHVDKIHHGYTGESSCNIKRLPRQPLRTILWSLQSKSNLKSLRKRHVSCPEVTCDKQDEVSSIRPGKFVKPKSKKRFKCEICHSLFTQKRSVLRHMNSRHNDEKPFQCAICGYAAKRKDHLSAHERSHFS